MAKKDKIVVRTIIKSCNVKEKGESLTFESISLTSDQREMAIQWVKDKEGCRLTVELLQENLPGMDGG